jgi:hypothetical protein
MNAPRRFVNKLTYSPRIVRFWLFMLGAFQIAALLLAFERPAQAYVDPGSGFVFLQVAGSMFAGALYYTRHRLRRLLLTLRRSSPIPPSSSSPAEAIENQQ